MKISNGFSAVALAVIVVAAVLIISALYFSLGGNSPASESEQENKAADGSARVEDAAGVKPAVVPSSGSSLGGQKVQTSLIKVTTPNGGENWESGGQYGIRWSHTNIIKSLAYSRTLVELVSREGTALEFKRTLFNFPQYIAAAPDAVQWIPTNIPDRRDYKIRVSYQTSNISNFGGAKFNGISYEDSSDGTFVIETKNLDKSYLKLVNPNGGNVFKVGDKYQISWQRNKIGTAVIVELYKGNSFVQRISSALGTYAGTIDWTVGTSGTNEKADLSPGADYRIRISTFPSAEYIFLEDYSDANFSIVK